MNEELFDKIGPWSEIKLDIVKEYASAYSTILNAQTSPRLKHSYVDAFAGYGIHISKITKAYVPGSPLNALNITQPFVEYHFIDVNQVKVKALEELANKGPHRVYVYAGDCNEVLLNKVFPKIRYENYRRGLCLLDPYGLQLEWEVVKKAGEMKTIEIFINFPIMDINRNVLRRDQSKVMNNQIERMNLFWGDESWRDIAYSTTGNLFGFEEKTDNETIAAAYRKRLKNVAGFSYVPEPIAMRNSTGATVYYLYFASPKPVAGKIVTSIFDKYRNRGL